MKPRWRDIALCCAAVASPAFAALDYSQPFNQASTIDGASNDGGGRNAGIGPVAGPAVLDVERLSSSNLPGRIEAHVRADYGALQAFLQTSGSITTHSASARSNEWFEINDPLVPVGTLGTMHIGYGLSGDATVHDAGGAGVPGEWVFADLSIFHGQTGTQPGTELGRLSRALVNGGAVGSPSSPSTLSVAVPFAYGMPFNVTTILGVSVVSDARFMFTAGGQLSKIAGVIDFLEADFGNSATLDAIFVPVGAILSAGSDFDYTPVLRFGAPVPVPPALGLFAGALAVLGAHHRRHSAHT
jgi:hypothetical protein